MLFLRFITAFDDYIRMGAITLLMLIVSISIGADGILRVALISAGVLLDVHDFVSKISRREPIV